MTAAATHTTLRSPPAAEWALPDLRNRAGLRAPFLPSGALFAWRHGETLISRALTPPLEDGALRLWLRRHAGAACAYTPVAGPGAPAAFRLDATAARWTGAWDQLAFTCTLTLHPDAAAWCWTLAVTNNAAEPCRVDTLHGQDLGLGDAGFVRTNEAFACQYIDHTACDTPAHGWVLVARQNLPQAGGAHPALTLGCLPRAAAYATDGLQVFGAAHRFTGTAAAAAPALPSARLQDEFAYPALQSAPVTLAPGASATFRFVALYTPDAPPQAAADAVAAWAALRFPDPEPAASAAATHPAPAAHPLYRAPLLAAGDPAEADLRAWVGDGWRHVERDGGALLSCFLPGGAHVVTAAKERLVERPHGHILRSGAGEFPRPDQLCATVYAHGLFATQVAVGHVDVGRLLSVVRDPLGVRRVQGLRVLVLLDGAWFLLGEPSVFVMEPDRCRWIYKLPGAGGRRLEVTTAIAADTPALTVTLAAHGVTPAWLLAADLVVGGRELEQPVHLAIDGARLTATPDPSTLLAQRLPGAGLALTLAPAPPAAAWAAAVPAAGGPGPWPTACIQTGPLSACTLTIAATGIATPAGAPIRPSAAPPRLAHPDDPGIARLDTILPWFLHDARIHFSAPHGLEQYGGGAWGVRDVCQGSVTYLLAAGADADAAAALRAVFARQDRATGDWPQWFGLPPFDDIRAQDAHGDVVFWPLQALCDYLEATGDGTLLDATLPRADGEPETLRVHAERAFARIRAGFLPGTHLVRYGHGDWDDSLQPAARELADTMVSSWTAALSHQTLARCARAWARAGHDATAARLAADAAAVRRDFERHLVADGVVCGFACFDAAGAVTRRLLHPADTETGIRYRLLPMTRAILAELFDPDQARRHLALIREHLRAPDGVRLMDRPAPYRGGREVHFRRAETATCFGREIGLMYVHAHLRYAEAMARLGDAGELLWALAAANPVDLGATVPNAARRQGNVYFTSSDAAFPDRAAAQAGMAAVRAGAIAVKGGWRLYSSGPGLALGLVHRHLLGLRREYDALVVDPVLPRGLDGLTAEVRLGSAAVRVRYHVGAAPGPVARVTVNGAPAPELGREANPYRAGGLRLDRAALARLLTDTTNRMEVYL